MLVNVGAKTTGLVHISQLDPSGGLVTDVEEVVRVGDPVLVRVLKGSNGKKLKLKLLRVSASLQRSRTLSVTPPPPPILCGFSRLISSHTPSLFWVREPHHTFFFSSSRRILA